jgi:hypothetical protein
MEIDEHLKYTLYVRFIFTPDTVFTANIPSQLAIRPLPQSRRAHGLPQDTRLLLVISAKKKKQQQHIPPAAIAETAKERRDKWD